MSTSVTLAQGRFCSSLPRLCVRCWRPTCPWFSLQIRTCRQPFTISPAKPSPCATQVRKSHIEQPIRWNMAQLPKCFHAHNIFGTTKDYHPLKSFFEMFGRVMWRPCFKCNYCTITCKLSQICSWIAWNCASAHDLQWTSIISVSYQTTMALSLRSVLSRFQICVKFQDNEPSIMCWCLT